MSTLNQQIAAILETRTMSPRIDTLALRMKLRRTDRYSYLCWDQYLANADYFPAGGLWFAYREWIAGENDLASPTNVAYMLDNDGDLPPVKE